MDHFEVAAILPQRYPFLLVDRIVEIDVGRRIVALKNVTVNEPFFSGHFPGHPLMPGVLLCEALVQAGGILAHATAPDSMRRGKIAMLSALDRTRFRQKVVPGDQLRLEVEAVRRRGSFWRMRGAALVAGKVVAELEFTLAEMSAEGQERL